MKDVLKTLKEIIKKNNSQELKTLYEILSKCAAIGMKEEDLQYSSLKGCIIDFIARNEDDFEEEILKSVDGNKMEDFEDYFEDESKLEIISRLYDFDTDDNYFYEDGDTIKSYSELSDLTDDYEDEIIEAVIGFYFDDVYLSDFEDFIEI